MPSIDIATNQLAKIHNSSLRTLPHSARNLGFMFDEHLTFSDQITSLSKVCYCHICQLRCIRSDTSIRQLLVYHYYLYRSSKLDYCNSLHYKLPKSQLFRLQQIENTLVHTVV